MLRRERRRAESGDRQAPPYPFFEQHTADEQHAESKRLPHFGIIAELQSQSIIEEDEDQGGEDHAQHGALTAGDADTTQHGDS
jgi:hypothetical protein